MITLVRRVFLWLAVLTSVHWAEASASNWQATYQGCAQAVDAPSSTLFAYDNAGHLIGEYDGSGAPIREYLWLGDTPVAVLKPNGFGTDIFYVHADHRNASRYADTETGLQYNGFSGTTQPGNEAGGRTCDKASWYVEPWRRQCRLRGQFGAMPTVLWRRQTVGAPDGQTVDDRRPDQ